jgi:carbon-monoxide dehydrogenase small subunit
VTTVPLSIEVNGTTHCVDVETRQLLVDFLRQQLNLTGTHIGCDTAQCGACTVLVNGDAVKSCTMLAVQADGCSVKTVESLAAGGALHQLQRAFHECHALQCGYCTPGFLMSALELLEKYDELDEASVRHLLDGNLCRCTGYNGIVKAIVQVAGARNRTPHARV